VTFDALVERARADERVVGVILTGSRGRNAFVTDASDWDVRPVARDADAEACRRDYGTKRGTVVEVVSYVDAELAFDRDGRVASLLARKAGSAVDPAAALDDYVNALPRSLPRARVTRATPGRT
jgi:hypothetical protein